VKRFVWSGADGTDRVGFLRHFPHTIIALELAWEEDHGLPVEAGGTRVEHESLAGQTQSVHVRAGLDIVQRVEDHVELLDLLRGEERVEDVVLDSHLVLVTGVFLCHLQCGLDCNFGLALVHVFVIKQELSVQVCLVNGVHVYHCQILNSNFDEVF